MHSQLEGIFNILAFILLFSHPLTPVKVPQHHDQLQYSLSVLSPFKGLLRPFSPSHLFLLSLALLLPHHKPCQRQGDNYIIQKMKVKEKKQQQPVSEASQ